MKKILLATFICSSFCFTARAQSKFSLGPNAGVGHSWVTKTDNAKFKLAANAGLALVYSATEHFGIGLDAKYSYEGVKSTLVLNSDGSIDLNYFRFPLKAIYFFNNYRRSIKTKNLSRPFYWFFIVCKDW
ncbi:MAG: hypothetical protein WKG06_46620 [Segetibacter sp.]